MYYHEFKNLIVLLGKSGYAYYLASLLKHILLRYEIFFWFNISFNELVRRFKLIKEIVGTKSQHNWLQ